MSSRILSDFELLVPQSIDEAVGLLARHGDRAAVMAGGTDLMVHLKSYGERTAFTSVVYPEYVLSLGEIQGLDQVAFSEKTGLRIGAMATLSEVTESDAVREIYPAIWKSAAENGTVQTRNAATLVGNLLRGSPAGDCCCAALALGGSVVLLGPEGEREVGVDDFWLGYRRTARKPDELALAVNFPPPVNGTVSAFSCLTRVKEDISKINAAVRLTLKGNRCSEARLAMGCVAPTPVRLKRSEALLEGSEITEDIYGDLMETVREEITPIDDVRSSAEYRREVAGVLVKRTIQAACNGLPV